MRTKREDVHTPCEDVLFEMRNCSIFFINRDKEEFIVCNSYCDEDPLYITRDELRQLAEQLIDLSKEIDS